MESRETLAGQALNKALEIRRKLNIQANFPLDIYSACEQLDITVQFVAIPSGEGMYWHENGAARILVSAHRPLPRKVFTCGHELGHHLFDHGSTIDELEESIRRSRFDPKEFLVDCFSGFFLMPKLAVQSAFSSRSWTPATATPLQVFTIACSFGVGYSTLIDHMTYALKLITETKAKELKKSSPKTIRQGLFGELSTNPLMVVDEQWLLKTVDVEVGYQILLPKTVQIEGDIVSFQTDTKYGRLFQADHSGLARAYCPGMNWAVNIRVSRFEYVGLSAYRHFGECDDE